MALTRNRPGLGWEYRCGILGDPLDGRTDIGWSRSLSCRYQLALAGLEELCESLRDMRERHADHSLALVESFNTIARSLGAFTECFKIGLEVFVKGRYHRFCEVPYVFTDRVHGTSKLTFKQMWEYVVQLVDLIRYRLFHPRPRR